ncbi:hypothetical protein ABPG74_017416 [Tetrahymena malaccensis]
MQQKNIQYQHLEDIYNKGMQLQPNYNMNDVFLNVSQHILNAKSEVTNSQLTKMFDHIQKKMEEDHQIQQKTSENINLVSQNKVYPVVKSTKKIDGLVNTQSTEEWNQRIYVILRILRQYLKDNDCELKFIINQSEQDKIEVDFGAWRLLTLNDTTNLKYCAVFKKYQIPYTQLKDNKNEISYICDLVQWAVASILKNFQKEDCIILNIVQSPNSNEDIEVHFILNEDDINHSRQAINHNDLSKELLNTIKSNFCSTITVCQKKVTKTITLTYNYFLKEFSRSWENLTIKQDNRGIKNGIKQVYYFPFSWFGFAIDVSGLDKNDQNWLSMDDKNPRAWPVGYLPATLINNDERFLYSQSDDAFTKSKIGSSVTVYRKPEDMEKKCCIIIDPQTNKRYKIGYLCRVNVDTLKCPQENQNVYQISNLKEVRPYRILLKEV